MLDEESVSVNPVEEQVLRELRQQKVMVMEEPVIVNELGRLATTSGTPVVHPPSVETPRVEIAETPRVETPREPAQRTGPKKEKRKKYSRKNQPKECVVSVDSLLSSVSQQ